MEILLTNDDGFNAEGIKILFEDLQGVTLNIEYSDEEYKIS